MRPMATGPRGPRPDGDGVRVVRTSGDGASWLVAAAVGIVAFLGVSMVRSTFTSDGAAAPPHDGGAPRPRVAGESATPIAPVTAPPPPDRVAAAEPAGPPPRVTARRRQPQNAAPAPESAPVAPNAPPAGDAATAEPNPGIFVFPPPGTDPPKSGIVVPEGVELPPGYVRHYQATDDGEQLEAILMFHPDYEFVDAAGRPIAIPPDRVVPPELAPPGIPVRMLVVPEPREPQAAPPPGRR